MKFIDLSVPLSPSVKEPLPPSIVYHSHEEGAEQGAKLLGIEKEAFRNGKAWATETVTANTHAGTHIDAPWHYGEQSAGRRARTIEEMPLDWFFRDAVLFDFSGAAPGYEISSEDFKAQLKDMNYTLKPYDIVLVRSDADKKLYDEQYAFLHAGVSAEATRWLLDQGIKVVGTDGWGWDIPFHIQAKQHQKAPEKSVMWEAHYVGIEKEYCQIEKLANLDKIPVRHGFTVACFPVNIEKASGAWTRPVACIEE
ncbi:Kynurenine formamidase [Alteribacillus persepolensis]|uniref:Kynurenine formamidase n=1 Tax=Alteribacillus persepolensis TaxID=568899 RepID=A0A1G8E9X8_9BACI|nr:cyclase family protein [Alteribacillus persepolensis]SDH66725.1 Kynurenine formamidase [Alteribacillus persepolensis]